MAPRLSSTGAALALGLLLAASSVFALLVAPGASLWLLLGVALVLSGLVIARQAESRAARLAGFVMPIAGLGIAGLAAGWLLGLYDLRTWLDLIVVNPVGFALAALGVLGAAAFIREGAQLVVDREWRAGLISLGIGVLGLFLLGGAVLGILLRSAAAITLLIVAVAIVAIVITSAVSIFVQPSSVATAGGPKLPGETPALPAGRRVGRRPEALLPADAASPTLGTRTDPLREALRRPEQTTALDLAGRGLASLPPEIGRLRNLRSLDLGEAIGANDVVLSNRLRTLPPAIGGLRRLESLNLAANEIESLPDELGWLDRLKSLNVSFNRLRNLPPALRSLRALETLRLERNGLEALPVWTGELRALRVLDLADNRLADLPPSLGALSELRALDLSHNRIATLPDTFGGLVRLESLALHANRLRVLPESFSQLRRLRTLSLGGNPLDLDGVVELLAQLPALEMLELGGIGATSLPESIGRLATLRTLILRGNALETLPASLGDLQRLECLDLANNRLHAIPESVRRLPLRRLDLDGNPLVAH
ncbi:MAG: hypothetical protein KatS3mg060_0393 [Dehalococcoidia bacterium]|nr:MAG: hypothetical protein KatS3mg060_0393 [Dehalococcoidia bacterium]